MTQQRTAQVTVSSCGFGLQMDCHVVFGNRASPLAYSEQGHAEILMRYGFRLAQCG